MSGVSGRLTPLLSEAPLTNADMVGFIGELMTPEYKKRFLETHEVDFSWAYGDKARFAEMDTLSARASVLHCGLCRGK